MKKNIICLGGLPGGGKSTVRDEIAAQLGMQMFSTGDYMRSIAKKRGMTFDEFNAHIATHKDDDELIDLELKRIQTEVDNIVVDSHLAFHFVPSGFKVFFQVSIEESARRIYKDRERETRKSVGDVMDSVEEAKKRIQARIENHNDRYMRHYGLSPYDSTQYDLVVDTEKHNPAEVAALVIAAFAQWRVS
jgi:predicted cytidylate kinase